MMESTFDINIFLILSNVFVFNFLSQINNDHYNLNKLRTMLEYLILNGKFEAARHYNDKPQTSLREELINLFNKGNRQQFLDIYNLLHKQSKLEFYLRVYFLIYSIHPFLKGKPNIPEPQKVAFKDYLDNKGAQLAKTNQFLQFYALPFIKKPLEHLAFKNLFKKQWVSNLKDKLQIFITEQQRLLKIQISKLHDGQPILASSSPDNKSLQQKVKQMQKINKKLFQEVKQFTEKYHILEDSHKAIMDGYHTHMMQSQSKWFQITKQLVQCSKGFIDIIVSSGSEFLSDRKFLKFKRRTQKYQRFVSKKFDDLITHSQDISILDRPSISDMSYSMAPYSQKNLTQASNILEDYVATNFQALKQYLKKGSNQQKISIINGLYWRILKSKNKQIRKLNILGILHYDALGIKSGQIQHLLVSRQLMKPIVRLIQVISLDNIGKKVAFNNNNLLKDFVGLINQSQDPSCFQYIISALGQISSEKCFKLTLIYLDIIEACVGVLRQGKYSLNETILQNTVAIMLNMLQKTQALKKYEKERDIFQVLKKHLRGKFRITRTLIYGIIFALLQSEQLFKRAHAQKMPQFFDNILTIDPAINRTQLKYLKNKLLHFEPKQKQVQLVEDEQMDNNQEQQDIEIEQEYLNQLEQMMVFHEQVIKKYALKGKQAIQQTKQIRQLLQQYRQNRIPTFQNVEENQIIQRVNSPKQKYIQLPPIQTPYLKQISDRQQLIKSQKPINKRLSNNFIGDEKPKARAKNRLQNQKQQKSYQNQDRRMRKSVSADKGIGKNVIQNTQIYQSNRFSNQISQFRAADEKKYRSPQQKRPRQEVLKQLNEQIKAEQKRNTTQNQNSMYVSDRQRGNGDHTEVFQSRPKLRRTPPRQ